MDKHIYIYIYILFIEVRSKYYKIMNSVNFSYKFWGKKPQFLLSRGNSVICSRPPEVGFRRFYCCFERILPVETIEFGDR